MPPSKLNILQEYQASNSTLPYCGVSTRIRIDHMESYQLVSDLALSEPFEEGSTLFHIVLKKWNWLHFHLAHRSQQALDLLQGQDLCYSTSQMSLLRSS